MSGKIIDFEKLKAQKKAKKNALVNNLTVNKHGENRDSRAKK